MTLRKSDDMNALAGARPNRFLTAAVLALLVCLPVGAAFAADTAAPSWSIGDYIIHIVVIGVVAVVAIFGIPVISATVIVAIKRLFGH